MYIRFLEYITQPTSSFFLTGRRANSQACLGLRKGADEELVEGGGVSNLLCDVEQQATDADGKMVKGGMGFMDAVDVDREEIAKETIGDVAEEVAEEMVECEAEGVVDTVTDKICMKRSGQPM